LTFLKAFKIPLFFWISGFYYYIRLYKTFIMKKTFWIYLLFFAVLSCKKENTTVAGNAQDSLAAQDSATISSPQNPEAFGIGTSEEKPSQGKTVFTENGNTILSFDTNAGEGFMIINDEKVPLTKLDFTENHYKITGKDISIAADNGDFDDTTGDCMSGTFPEIKITYKGHTVSLAHIRVQDCPSY